MLKIICLISIFFIFVVRCSEVVRRDCPRGWIKYDRTKSCFLVHDARLKWNDAERNCQRHGGHLASVSDEYENIFLFDLAKKANLTVPTVWLGKIIKLSKNGAYEWNDGTIGRYGAGFREPPSGNNICLTMWADYEKPDGSWNEWDCGYPTGYASICKKSFRRGTPPQQVVAAASASAINNNNNGQSTEARNGNDKTLSGTLASASASGAEPTPPQHASKRCCVSCPNKCGTNERCIPDDLNCLIKSCNNTAPGWCLPVPNRF
uniref:C-type lectin domain-containing protein n=1 Tax=Panagrolaimus sp. PS1159 TaxID=55785 RepID=A0AC35F4D9_9BILA